MNLGTPIEPLMPRWARLEDAARYSTLGRTTLYDAIKSGAVASYKLGPKGRKKSVRLIDLHSLDEFIRSGGKK
jgi:hypothetical protein